MRGARARIGDLAPWRPHIEGDGGWWREMKPTDINPPQIRLHRNIRADQWQMRVWVWSEVSHRMEPHGLPVAWPLTGRYGLSEAEAKVLATKMAAKIIGQWITERLEAQED